MVQIPSQPLDNARKPLGQLSDSEINLLVICVVVAEWQRFPALKSGVEKLYALSVEEVLAEVIMPDQCLGVKEIIPSVVVNLSWSSCVVVLSWGSCVVVDEVCIRRGRGGGVAAIVVVSGVGRLRSRKGGVWVQLLTYPLLGW